MNPSIIIYLFAILLSIIGPAKVKAQQVADAWVYGGNDRVTSNNCYIDQLGNRYQVVYTLANYFTVDSLGYPITINNPKLNNSSMASIIKFDNRGVYQYNIDIPNGLSAYHTSVTFDRDNNAYFSSRIYNTQTTYSIYDGRKTAHTLQVIAGHTVLLGKLTTNGQFSWLRIMHQKLSGQHHLLTTNSTKNEIKLITRNYRPTNTISPDTLIITSNSNLIDTIVVNSVLLHLTFLSNGQFKNYTEPFKNQLTNTYDGGINSSPYNFILSKNKENSLSIITLDLTANDTLFLLNNTIPLYQGINTVLICTNDNDSIIWAKPLSTTITWTQITTTCDTAKNEFNIFFRFNPAMDIITIDPSLNNSLIPVMYHLKLNTLTGSLINVKNLPAIINSVIWNPISKKYIYSTNGTYGYLDSNSNISSTKSVIPGPTSGLLLSTSNTTDFTIDPNGYTYITGSITDSIKIDCINRYANPNHIRQKVLVVKIAPLITQDTAACKPTTSPSRRYLWDTSGVYYDTIPSITNCDSVLEIRFTNLSSKINYDTAVHVLMQSPSGKYIWDSTGIYNDTLTNKFNCDSIIIFNLKVLQTKHTIDTNVCNTYKSPSGIYWLNKTGTYTDTIPNTAGADSIITINLRVLKSFSNFDTIFCSSITSPSGNYIYSTSGIYTDTIPNTVGCDSIISIRFSLLQTTDTITVSSCNTFISPSGKYTYTQTGTYNDTLQTKMGCDSIVWIKFTNKKTIDTLPIHSCDAAISPSGKFIMNLTGIYIDTLTNNSGCDSILLIQFRRDTFTVYLSKSNNISCYSPTAYLTTSTGNLFTWFANGNILTNKSATILVSPNIQTRYKVIAQNNLGCTATDSIVVDVNIKDSAVTFPNVFTPNNDGTNDCYSISGIENYSKIVFEVYNRWGLLIFKTTNPTFCWNGLSNNEEEVLSGTYYYIFEGTSNCVSPLKSSGTITLIK